MNIETKTLNGGYSEYEKFGWKYSEDIKKRGSRGHHYTAHVLTRDKDMPNYAQIAALEDKYFSLKAEKKVYQPIEAWAVIFLFFLFVIPLIIYVAVKNSQKKKIAENNARIDREMKTILKEAAALL